jgi:cystathionine beta-lyase
MATSKTFNLAGIKMATTIIPNADIMAQWKTKTFANENPLSIAAAQAAWQHGGEWLAQLKDYLDANFKYLDNYLKNHLPQANFSIPDATYLAWIDVGTYFTEEENLTLFFANKAGVLLEGGNMFVDNADGYIRLNLACPKSELKEGLDRIAKAINI